MIQKSSSKPILNFNLSRRIVEVFGLVVVFSMTTDMYVNNWDMIDIFGDGKDMRIPVLNIHDMEGLGKTNLAYHPIFRPSHLSKMGYSIINEVVKNMADRSDSVNLLEAGSYVINRKEMDLCGKLMGNFSFEHVKLTHEKNFPANIRLGWIGDSVTFLNGYWGTADLNAIHKGFDAKREDIEPLGYVPARFGTDFRITSTIDLELPHNASRIEKVQVQMYQIYVKSFCSGCNGMAQLGISYCDLKFSYNMTEKKMMVYNSIAPYGSKYYLGVYQTQSYVALLTLGVKGISFLILVFAFQASRKTIIWKEISDLQKINENVFYRIKEALIPGTYKFSSDTMKIGMFCLNSDIIVILYSISTMIDLTSSDIFAREVEVWDELHPNWWMVFRIFTIEMRKVWWALGLIKILKIVFCSFSTEPIIGKNRALGYLTFLSGINVYLLVIGLCMWPMLSEHINGDRVDIDSLHNKLDDIHVSYLQSFYMRTYPLLIAWVFCNIVFCLMVDKLLMYSQWQSMLKNSVTGNLIYNSSAVCADLFGDLDSNALTMKARKLCTARWYLNSHCTKFGLAGRRTTRLSQVSTQKIIESVGVDQAAGSTSSPIKNFDCDSTIDVDYHYWEQNRSGVLYIECENKEMLSTLSLNLKVRHDASLSFL